MKKFFLPLLLAHFATLAATSQITHEQIECSQEKQWDCFADVLYWHTGEVGMIPNSTLAVTTTNKTLVSKLSLNTMKFGWDLGFRLGGSYDSIGQDKWGISLTYTRFRTETSKSGAFTGFVGIPSGFPLTGTLSDVDFVELFWLFGAKSFQAHWDLHYDIADLVVDHEFPANESLSFRPYLGVRGGWINQDVLIRSIYANALANNAPVPAAERLKNHYRGMGPLCGLDSKWWLGSVRRHSFYLFGDLAGAFMLSFWGLSDVLSLGDFANARLRVRDRHGGAFMLQDLMGVEWNVQMNRRGTFLAVRLAYEAQFWFDNLQIFSAFNGRQHNALTLQGGTFDFSFNY